MLTGVYIAALALPGALAFAAIPQHPAPPPAPPLSVTVFPHRNWVLLRVSLSASAAATKRLTCAIAPSSGGGPCIWKQSTAAPQAGGSSLSIEARPADPPAAWELAAPALYQVSCSTDSNITAQARFGFRDFAAAGGQFLLNGRPVFLRGWSINPPGRGLPPAAANKSFAMGYLTWMRDRAGVNAVCIGDGASSANHHWYDSCDELGILIYSGPYGGVQCPGCAALKAPEARLRAAVGRYQSVLMATASHPSHVILILSNEVGLDDTPSWQSGKSADAGFLRNISAALARWDPTRVYLGDAGFGLGRGGQVDDDHTYYGWYIGDANSYVLHGQNHSLADGQPPLRGSQPQTFTECVGNYLTAAGDFDVAGKNWAWALKWAGASQGDRSADAHAAYVARQSVEIVRRRRRLNPALAGIMPFHSPFYYCGDEVHTFAQMSAQPSPVVRQLATSFAPVLVSIESWTPHLFAGGEVAVKIHAVNDDRRGAPLPSSELLCRWLTIEGQAVGPALRRPFPALPYYGTALVPLNLTIPSGITPAPAGSPLRLAVRLINSTDNSPLATNEEEFVVFPRPVPPPPAKSPPTKFALLDPVGSTAAALVQLGLQDQFTRVTRLHAQALMFPCLVIGENAWTGGDMAANVSTFVRRGGRAAILQQSEAPATFDPGFLDAGLTAFEMVDRVGHSARNVPLPHHKHPG